MYKIKLLVINNLGRKRENALPALNPPYVILFFNDKEIIMFKYYIKQ